MNPKAKMCAHLLGVLAASAAHATTYYVATNGSDSNNGTTTSSPFLTLQRAANSTQPGDTVSVMSGTYTAPCAGCDVVKILQSGTSSAPITYTAYNGTRPLIDTSQSWQGFHIDASYITFEGFEIVGAASRLRCPRPPPPHPVRPTRPRETASR